MSPRYRPDIDGLRAIAILLVVIYHFFPSVFPGGFIGVDIFFVISGFLISGILLRSLEKSSFSFRTFYARRIRRIFPALIMIVAACLIFGWFCLFGVEYAALGWHAFGSAFFFSNFQFHLETNYFSPASDLNPLLHIWSLGVEEQFYLVWPLILFLAYKAKKRRIALILVTLCAGSFLINFLGFMDQNSFFYLPFGRLWEFLAGAILAYTTLDNFAASEGRGLKARFDNLSPRAQAIIHELLSAAGLILIIVSAYFLGEQTFYAHQALLPATGAVLLLMSGNRSLIGRFLLSNPVMVFIGLISYSLYLWHWPLLSFATIIQSGHVSQQTRIMLTAASFVLAALSYFVVERPTRHAKGKIAVAIMCILMAFTGIAGLMISDHAGFKFRFPAQENLLKTMTVGPQHPTPCDHEYAELGTDWCISQGTGPNIFFVGDSHAGALFPGYSPALIKEGYTAVSLAEASCPFIVPETMLRNMKSPDYNVEAIKKCNALWQNIIWVISYEHTAGIVYAQNGWGPAKKDLYAASVEETFSRIPSNIKIAWVLQVPRIPYSLECVPRPFSDIDVPPECSYDRKIYDDFTKGYFDVVNAILKKHPNVTAIDPAKALCDKDTCMTMRNGQFLYNQTNHLSIIGSTYISKKLPIDYLFSTSTKR